MFIDSDKAVMDIDFAADAADGVVLAEHAIGGVVGVAAQDKIFDADADIEPGGGVAVRDLISEEGDVAVQGFQLFLAEFSSRHVGNILGSDSLAKSFESVKGAEDLGSAAERHRRMPYGEIVI